MDTLSKSLDDTFGNLLTMLSSPDDSQLNTVPFPGSWTAAQVGDHLRQSYNVVSCLTGRTAKTTRDPDMLVTPVTEQFLNFNIKMNSPDFIRPQEGHIEKSGLIKDLEDRTRMISGFANGDYDMSLMCLDFELPNIGTMTRREWLNFVLVHTQRHNYQLQNIINKLNEDIIR